MRSEGGRGGPFYGYTSVRVILLEPIKLHENTRWIRAQLIADASTH